MREEYRRLFDAARAIARALDSNDSRLACSMRCSCVVDGYEGTLATYSDDLVKIVAGKNDPRLGIELTENGNPVVCIWESGKVIRTHGELHEVKDHILKLANPLRLLAEQGEDE